MPDTRTGRPSALQSRTHRGDRPAGAQVRGARRVSHGGSGAGPAVRLNSGGRDMAAPPPGAAPSPPPITAWCETGRAEPGDALWITWMASLGDRGDVLYRSLVVADGAIAVSVEWEPRPGGGAVRAIHRGRCGLPPSDDARGVEGRAALLLAAADKAVARALEAARTITCERAPIRAADRGQAPGPEARSIAPRPGASTPGTAPAAV